MTPITSEAPRLDLAKTTVLLAQACGEAVPRGYLRGKTYIRDAAVSELDFSQLQAEVLVDTLEFRGYLTFVRDQHGVVEGGGAWRFNRAHD